MSRPLTPQELEEFNLRRRKSLEETASQLGLSPERLEKIEQEARQSEHHGVKKQAESALRSALEMAGRGFVENLKTDNQREALDTVRDINGMSDEDFSRLLARRMAILDEQERREASKMAGRKIACWRENEESPLSLREEILLELQSMIRRHNYYAKKK